MKLISPEEFKRIILDTGLVTEQDFLQAEKNANLRHRPVEDILIERGIINSTFLLETVANYIKVPYVELKNRKIDDDILHLIQEESATTYQTIAFAKDEQQLLVAMADPTDMEVVKHLRDETKLDIIPFLASEKDILKNLKFYKVGIQEKFNAIIQEQAIASSAYATSGEKAIDIPIITVVDTILEYAVFEEASDIHIEPLSDSTIIRFRIDGLLQDVLELPARVHKAIISRIKIMANIKIDEHYRALDGRFGFDVNEQSYTTRVSIIPTFHGQKIVLRILDEEGRYANLEDLGMEQSLVSIVEKTISKPYGLVLVVGPTGSGKSSSLYVLLSLLNQEHVNISTIEDPIESNIRRINQSQVNELADYTFANGLRALLRQDPDIIMVGEIRDTETTSMVIQSALTGHLVLSTLHTNNAASTIPRLLDMGVESFLLASTLNLIIAQRLVRRICPHCIESHKLAPYEVEAINKQFNVEHVLHALTSQGVIHKNIDSLAGMDVYRGRGCPICKDTGYLGRIGIYEVLEVSEKIKQLINQHAPSSTIEQAAVGMGMQTLLQNGLQKVFAGQTTLQEVLRVTKEK